jgi:adenylosuccinate synthase
MVHVVVGADFYGDGVGALAARMAGNFDIVLRFGADSGALIHGVVNVVGDGAELDVLRLITDVREAVSAGEVPSLLVSERARLGAGIQVSQLYEEGLSLPPDLLTARELLRPYVGDAVKLVERTLRDGGRVLLYGAGGALSDMSVEAFPPGSAAGTLTAFGCLSAGLPPTAPDAVTAVFSAYACVPAGIDFVPELTDEEGSRRVGWLDTVAVRYGCRIQGATEIVLTGLEVLEGQREVKVCVGYALDGETAETLPACARLRWAQPVYAVLPGWSGPLRGCPSWRELPEGVRLYADFLEKTIGLRVAAVSVGPAPDDIIFQ